jgi:hypothetical protein
MSYIGLICQLCFHFLPEEHFLSDIKNDEEKYMGCCRGCRDTTLGQFEGYIRRIRNEEITNKTVYDYKCTCGSIIKITKYNKNFTLGNHIKSASHQGKKKIKSQTFSQKKKRQQYYLKTKNITQATINCECGGTYRSNSGSKNRHEKTKKHQNYFL